MNKKEATALVLVMSVDGKFTIGCNRCGKVVSTISDGYLVGLIVTEPDGRVFKYFVAEPYTTTCCAGSALMLKHFANEADADSEFARVRTHLNQTGSTEGLALVTYIHPSSN